MGQATWAGKCNINAAPNETVAHEIAVVVSEMLLDAFGQAPRAPRDNARQRACSGGAWMRKIRLGLRGVLGAPWRITSTVEGA